MPKLNENTSLKPLLNKGKKSNFSDIVVRKRMKSKLIDTARFLLRLPPLTMGLSLGRVLGRTLQEKTVAGHSTFKTLLVLGSWHSAAVSVPRRLRQEVGEVELKSKTL